MPNLFTFPSPFIYSTKVNNHEQIKQEALPKILQLAKENQTDFSYEWIPRKDNNMVTNFNHATNNINDCLNPSDYDDIVWTPLDEMFSSLMANEYSIDYTAYRPMNSIIERIWWNVYSPGSYAPAHNHGPAAGRISGVYILQSNETNNTVFVADNAHTAISIYITPHTTEYLNEGHVMLFPSSLMHYTLPCLDNRVSISFNLQTEFKYMSKEVADSHIT